MAYQDGTTTLRYYPIELDPAQGHSPLGDAVIGLGVRWVTGREYPLPDPATMGMLDNATPWWDGNQVRPIRADQWYEKYLSGGRLATPPAGKPFTERPFVLLTEAGAASPITPDMLPMEVKISAGIDHQGGYAGGVIQIGIYIGGEFAVLGATSYIGSYVHSDAVPDDALDRLPPRSPDEDFLEGVDGSVVLTLRLGDMPASLFWTQLVQSAEEV